MTHKKEVLIRDSFFRDGSQWVDTFAAPQEFGGLAQPQNGRKMAFFRLIHGFSQHKTRPLARQEFSIENPLPALRPSQSSLLHYLVNLSGLTSGIPNPNP
jgi:hypothetical protein